MRADIDLYIKQKTFASGLLPELIDVLQRSRPGDLVGVVADEASIGPELETWCRLTGNTLVESTIEKGRARWVFRYGAIPIEDNRPVGSAIVVVAMLIVAVISVVFLALNRRFLRGNQR